MLTLSLGFAAVLLALLVAAQAAGPGDWLESPTPANWNVPAAALPVAPPPRFETDPRCGAQERPSESPEEDQVVAAGWRIFNGALVGWGVRVVYGLVNYDGMCRPLAFHAFVFADGQFAGTISPTSLDSRTDGVGRVLDLNAPGRPTAQFVRYKATDPLCCPSSTFFVDYEVDRTGEAPVLVPRSSTRTGPP